MRSAKACLQVHHIGHIVQKNPYLVRCIATFLFQHMMEQHRTRQYWMQLLVTKPKMHHRCFFTRLCRTSQYISCTNGILLATTLPEERELILYLCDGCLKTPICFSFYNEDVRKHVDWYVETLNTTSSLLRMRLVNARGCIPELCTKCMEKIQKESNGVHGLPFINGVYAEKKRLMWIAVYGASRR